MEREGWTLPFYSIVYLTLLLMEPPPTATAPISTTSRAVVSRIVNARRFSVGRP
jgi:hypothetical protein